jgi:hypothetical protein
MPESEVPDKFVPYSAVNVLPNFRTISCRLLHKPPNVWFTRQRRGPIVHQRTIIDKATKTAPMTKGHGNEKHRYLLRTLYSNYTINRAVQIGQKSHLGYLLYRSWSVK